MLKLPDNISLLGNEIPSLAAIRQKGKNSFLAQGLPTPKTEAWKYTKTRELNTSDYVILPVTDTDSHTCSCHQKTLDFDAYEIKFCNGKFCHSHFHLPDEIEVMTILDAIKNKEVSKFLNKNFNIDTLPFAALNNAYLEQGVFIRVAKDFCADKPIVLIYKTDDKQKYLNNIRNIIVTESNSQVQIVEYYYHIGDVKAQYFNNIVNEIFIGKNAYLNHYKIQNEAFKSAHIAFNSVSVKSYGKYESVTLQKGANLARNETKVNLTEEHAETIVNAAYIINGWACVDTTTNIEHIVPNTHSNQLIKGVIGEQAKGVFQGKIHINPNAVNTQGYQLHKALILSDNAEADVKPELEIYADDVKCSHGATCGEIDAEQLFYLCSRGIDKETAKQILIDAFVEEVFEKIPDENIKNWFKSF